MDVDLTEKEDDSLIMIVNHSIFFDIRHTSLK